MAVFAKYTLLTALGATALTQPAFAGERKTEITPYIEIGQVVSADLSGANDVLTYSQVSAGIEAEIVNRRSEFNMSYRYERRIKYNKGVGDEDSHSGLMRGRYDVVPNMLSIEGGAIATRARSDIRGAAPLQTAGKIDNSTQVYSGYAGPTFATKAGPLDVAAAYRMAYTKVEAKDQVNLPTGQQSLDAYDDSLSHYATGSVGMAPGTLPFGWAVSAGYERENAGQLKQRYEGKNVRGDVQVPVTQALSLVGGIGYEDIRISQKDPLLDAAGKPVTTTKGRYVTDPASPRRIAYDMDGLYWDTGVVWKPSPRTMLEARVGRRYDGWSYTGSFAWQANGRTGMNITAYDSVDTFGQQLADNLSLMPINFRRARAGGVGNNYGGCVAGGSFGGSCNSDAFQSINTAAYRNRGVTAMIGTHGGRWNSGFGIGYNQRKFLAPNSAGTVNVNGLKDQYFYAQANVEYELTERSSIEADLSAGLYDPGIAGAGDVRYAGGNRLILYQLSTAISVAR